MGYVYNGYPNNVMESTSTNEPGLVYTFEWLKPLVKCV